MKDIGRKIRELREQQGMTQEELAHKVGYKSRVSINKIELQRDIPLNKVVPIANALGVSPSELTGWDEEYKSEKKFSDILATEDIELLALYYTLSESDKRIIQDMIRSLAKKPQKTKLDQLVQKTQKKQKEQEKQKAQIS